MRVSSLGFKSEWSKRSMSEKEINNILDNLDFENNEEFDVTKEEYDVIIQRNRLEYDKMHIEQFIYDVMLDCYRLGFAKALLIAQADNPRTDTE